MNLEENKPNSSGVNLNSRQTFNPTHGTLHFEGDKIYVLYNPFDKMKADRYIKKIDEFAVTVFVRLKKKYKENPKRMCVSVEESLKRIEELNQEVDPRIIFDSVFKDEGQKVKFKLFTEGEDTFARLMLDSKENFVKNFRI